MIIGKDKEKVEAMDIEMQLANSLILRLRNDMEEILEYLIKTYGNENMFNNTTLWKLPHDIGMCNGHLDIFG